MHGCHKLSNVSVLVYLLYNTTITKTFEKYWPLKGLHLAHRLAQTLKIVLLRARFQVHTSRNRRDLVTRAAGTCIPRQTWTLVRRRIYVLGEHLLGGAAASGVDESTRGLARIPQVDGAARSCHTDFVGGLLPISHGCRARGGHN